MYVKCNTTNTHGRTTQVKNQGFTVSLAPASLPPPWRPLWRWLGAY